MTSGFLVYAGLTLPQFQKLLLSCESLVKEIDPTAVRPSYPREGEIVVHAGLPHHGSATAAITFTSTGGKHTATCEVKVKR